MKNYILLCLVASFIQGINSQVKYQEGYYITNSGEQITGLIEDANWNRNPESFKFKSSKGDNTSELDISDVSEFGIFGKTKFVRRTANLEISSNKLNKLSNSKTLERQVKQVFLKVVVEGDVSLYEYRAPDITNFFYEQEKAELQLLEYKRYVENAEVKTNESYKNQLFLTFKCNRITLNRVRRMDYESRDLSKFFNTYNNCNKADATTYFNRQQEQLLIGIQPVISTAFLNLNFAADENRPLRDRLDADFDNEFQFRFGVEFEYLFSFQKQKWSIFLAPLFQKYSSSTQTLDTDNTTIIDIEADYTSFEIASGVRHYMYITDLSTLFIEGGVTFDFPISNSTINFSNSTGNLSLDSNANFLVGLGYRYDKKYGLHLRYQFNRDILKNFEAYEAKFSSLSLIFSYYFDLNIAGTKQ